MLPRYEKHAAKRQFHRMVKEKVQKKIEAYEQNIEKRREKWERFYYYKIKHDLYYYIFRLEELFCKEERQYFYETIEKAQKHENLLMEEKKRKLNVLKAKREEERLALVHQKRIDQYRYFILSCQKINIWIYICYSLLTLQNNCLSRNEWGKWRRYKIS